MPGKFFNLFTQVLVFLTLACTPIAYSQSDIPSLQQDGIDNGIDTLVKDPCKLRLEQQHLWINHVALTHFVIVSLSRRLPDTKASLDRLLKNQEEIGNSIKPYYGTAAAKKLTALLKEHINIAGKLVVAVRERRRSEAVRLGELWYKNADSIAAFLHDANPKNWSLAELKSMMRKHLDVTAKEAMAYLQGNYKQSMNYYDQAHAQIMKMAEMLADGIIKQFP